MLSFNRLIRHTKKHFVITALALLSFHAGAFDVKSPQHMTSSLDTALSVTDIYRYLSQTYPQ